MTLPAERETGRKRVAGETRRAQLIEVALRLFAERGYDGTATRDIAAAAGVAEGLLFRHFPTKRELLAAVLAEYGPRHQFLQIAPQLGEMSVRDALVRVYAQRVDLLWDNRLFVRLVMAESRGPGEAAEEFRAMLEEGPRLVAELLRARMARGELRCFDADVGASMLGGAVFSYFVRHQTLAPEQGRAACRSFVEDCVDLFLSGALPVPPGPPT